MDRVCISLLGFNVMLYLLEMFVMCLFSVFIFCVGVFKVRVMFFVMVRVLNNEKC